MRAIETLKSALRKGFIRIFSANFVNRLILFGYSAFFSHFFDRSLWNSYTYANNILAYFLLLQGLGAPSGVIQYCSANITNSERHSYLKYSLKVGFIANIVAMLAVIVFASIFDLRVPGSREILLLLCLQPVIQIGFDIFQNYFRATLRNKAFSWISIGQSVPFLIFVVGLGYLFKIPGIVAGKYLSYVPALVMIFLFMGTEWKQLRAAIPLTRDKSRTFLGFSITAALSNSISQILLLVDITIIGQMLPAYVGAYSNASRIPFNLYFIPASIIIFVYPFFVKMAHDVAQVKRQFYRMQRYLMAINAIISISLIALAPWLIPLIWGAKYQDSVPPFQVLMIGYFIIGSFRLPASNIIACLGKMKINLYNNVISLVLNIILEVLLIGYGRAHGGPAGGMLGAAIATVIVYGVTAIIGNSYLAWYFRRHERRNAA
jgi:O-antigen/teichoic acid export membrane protein